MICALKWKNEAKILHLTEKYVCMVSQNGIMYYYFIPKCTVKLQLVQLNQKEEV